jgi:hypothetical protein
MTKMKMKEMWELGLRMRMTKKKKKKKREKKRKKPVDHILMKDHPFVSITKPRQEAHETQ